MHSLKAIEYLLKALGLLRFDCYKKQVKPSIPWTLYGIAVHAVACFGLWCEPQDELDSTLGGQILKFADICFILSASSLFITSLGLAVTMNFLRKYGLRQEGGIKAKFPAVDRYSFVFIAAFTGSWVQYMVMVFADSNEISSIKLLQDISIIGCGASLVFFRASCRSIFGVTVDKCECLLRRTAEKCTRNKTMEICSDMLQEAVNLERFIIEVSLFQEGTK